MTSAATSSGRPLGIWEKSGSTVKIAYIVKPQKRAARLVKSTGRRASIRMLTMGCAVRSSTKPQTTRTTRPTAMSPRSLGEPQPQDWLSVSATRMQARPPESSTAPGMSSTAGARVGEGGTTRRTSTIPSRPTAAPTTKSQRHEAWSTIRPDSTSPIPPPRPSIAEIRPIATPLRLGSTSSRMIEKQSG